MTKELKQQYNEMLRTMELAKSDTDYQRAYCAVNRIYDRLATLLRREFMRAIVNSPVSLKVTHQKRVVKHVNKSLGLEGDQSFKYYLGDRDFSYNVSLGYVNGTYPYLLPGCAASAYCYFCTIGWRNEFPRDVWAKELQKLDDIPVLTAEEAVAQATEAVDKLRAVKAQIDALIDNAELDEYRDMFTKHNYLDVSYPHAGADLYLAIYQSATVEGGLK